MAHSIFTVPEKFSRITGQGAAVGAATTKLEQSIAPYIDRKIGEAVEQKATQIAVAKGLSQKGRGHGPPGYERWRRELVGRRLRALSCQRVSPPGRTETD